MPGPVIKPIHAFARSLLAATLGVDVILTPLLHSGGRSHVKGDIVKGDIVCPESVRRQRSGGDRIEVQSVLLIAMSHCL